MKRVIFVLISVFCIISCNDDKESFDRIRLNELPEKLEGLNEIFRQNNEENYFHQAVKLTKGRDVYYLIHLNLLDLIIADKKGNWIAIYGTTKRTTGVDLPKNLIPESVNKHRVSEIFWIHKRKKGGYNAYDGNNIIVIDEKNNASILSGDTFGYGEIEEWFIKELGFAPFVYY